MQQFEIFSQTKEQKIQLENAELSWFADIGLEQDAFDEIFSSVDWQSEAINIMGKERLVPRLVAWYGDEGADYSYSGVHHVSKPWIPSLKTIKARVEQVSGYRFNSALCNLYRNGQDSMGWHSDDERELGEEPVIASVSLGATREFQLKHKTIEKLRHKIMLTSGSLLVMKAGVQRYWKHQVPKRLKIEEPRINITFRTIINN